MKIIISSPWFEISFFIQEPSQLSGIYCFRPKRLVAASPCDPVNYVFDIMTYALYVTPLIMPLISLCMHCMCFYEIFKLWLLTDLCFTCICRWPRSLKRSQLLRYLNWGAKPNSSSGEDCEGVYKHCGWWKGGLVKISMLWAWGWYVPVCTSTSHTPNN
jgi:hypothetical protein